MASTNEQRICIKFCVKLGKAGSETLEKLKTTYGGTALAKTAVYDWHKRFKGSRDSVEDDDRSGRPSTSRTECFMLRVRSLIMADRRLTIREISSESGLSFGTCQSILTQDLGMKRISEKLVSKLLTDEEKQITTGASVSRQE